MQHIIPHSRPTTSYRQAQFLMSNYYKRVWSTGEITTSLESMLANKNRRKFAIVVNSGTSALHLLLQTVVKQKNDEVILPGYSCTDLANAVLLAGGSPVFLRPNCYGEIIASDIENKITQNTKAIIIQHLFGKPFKMPKTNNIQGVKIIEDCTHTFESFNQNTDIVISLGATKLVSGIEGGVLLTDDEDTYIQIRTYLSGDSLIRFPYRYSDLLATIAFKQSQEFESNKEKRWKIAKYYTYKFGSSTSFELPSLENYSIPYRYVVKFDNSKRCSDFINFSSNWGVNCVRPVSPHYLIENSLDIKNVVDTLASIPIYPGLKKLEMLRVIKMVLYFIRS